MSRTLKTNIANLRSHLSEYMSHVESGNILEIQKRNIVFARVFPIKAKIENKTKLGCGKGSVKILGDLTEPSTGNWDMLKD